MLHMYPIWAVWVCNSFHNQTESSISPYPIRTYIRLRALTISFSVLESLRLNIASRNYHSNDDVSVLSGSNSDISETVEKADFVEFLDNDNSTLAGSEADLDT